MVNAVAGVLALKMIIAAISGMGAATLCHPLDVIRVQMQTDGSQFSGPIECAKSIVSKRNAGGGSGNADENSKGGGASGGGGIKALYAGIGAAYLRQWLYGSCRIGIYAFLLERAQTANLANGLDKNAIPFMAKLLMGCTSGGIGSFVGTPAELALVRMSNDSKLPVTLRRNYKGVGDCISRIAKEEGVLALWTGAQVTVLRAMVLSAAVLGITSEIKIRLKASGIFGQDGEIFHGLPLMCVAILVSSFCANIVANPFDVVKSRTQQQSKIGPRKYTSMLDCFVKIVSQEGILKLWAGFVPAFIKLAPYTIISLLLTEKITQMVTGKAAL